ncbi:hypothetical protein BDZ89DRAFT_1120462 [Hymenopellis radicata]|nr:hypothetical protein BDZ89DRAFT_1120462 [Hymenopellis radicata]
MIICMDTPLCERPREGWEGERPAASRRPHRTCEAAPTTRDWTVTWPAREVDLLTPGRTGKPMTREGNPGQPSVAETKREGGRETENLRERRRIEADDDGRVGQKRKMCSPSIPVWETPTRGIDGPSSGWEGERPAASRRPHRTCEAAPTTRDWTVTWPAREVDLLTPGRTGKPMTREGNPGQPPRSNAPQSEARVRDD